MIGDFVQKSFFGFKSFFPALKPDLKTKLQFLTLEIEEKVKILYHKRKLKISIIEILLL